MSQTKTLHITNGGSLTEALEDLGIKGAILTWQEMLCEGPTISNINSPSFFELRKQFLNQYYQVDTKTYEQFEKDLEILDQLENYSEIVLWFEYDLFCHINLLGVLNLLNQRRITLPLYLVCSGRISGEKELKGLAELSVEQLIEHYKSKVKITSTDLDLTLTLWDIYCGKDHNLLKPYIIKESSFKYLSNCLKAHLKRFPDSRSGLDAIEANILTLIRDKDIKSRHHLLGYIINYQGYYGFGDLQLERIINKLSIFFNEDEAYLSLNRKGHEALLSHFNACSKVNHQMTFGGVNRLDFQYSKSKNKLVNTVIHAN